MKNKKIHGLNHDEWYLPRYFKAGLLILLGFFAAMLVLTVLQILLFQETGVAAQPSADIRSADHRFAAKTLAVRTSAINILLGAGGMGALFCLGRRTYKKLNTLQKLVQPLEEKDYPALFSQPLSGDEEPYRELKKAAGELGKFIEMFRAHVKGNAGMEELLTEIKTGTVNGPQETGTQDYTGSGPLTMCLGEITSSAEQAESALVQMENYFSSADETYRRQGQAMEEADSRLAVTAELEQSIAVLLEESKKKAGDLKDKINNGGTQSQASYNIIKATSKDIEKITGIVKIINDISVQTNILSINAAIESAHAGSAGAGFAVVAAEIRKLAESTRENADSIQAVLRAITQQISDALKASEVSSLAFGTITEGIAGFTDTLGSAVQGARENSNAGTDIKAVLASGGSGKLQDNSVDIAALIHSYRSSLGHINKLCETAKTEAGGSTFGTRQFKEKLESAVDKVRDYLKETEELEGILLKRESSPSSDSSLAAITRAENNTDLQVTESGGNSPGESSDREIAQRFVRNTEADSTAGVEVLPATFKQPGLDLSAVDVSTDKNTGSYSPAAVIEAKNLLSEAANTDSSPAEEDDNSWRRDVTVKLPPRTVS